MDIANVSLVALMLIGWAIGLVLVWFFIRSAVLSALKVHARNQAIAQERVAAIERARAAGVSQ